MVDSADLQPVLTTPNNERFGTFSPEGRYLVYQSDESGRPEIYVRGLSEAGVKRQISADGGFTPKWHADGQELYFWDADNNLVAVPVQASDRKFEAGQPQKLFQHAVITNAFWGHRFYDVAATGDRFYLNVLVDDPEQAQCVVVLNWDAELEK